MSHLRRLDGLRADRRDFGFPVGGDSRNIPVHVRVFAEGLVVTPAAGLATGLLISFGRLAPGWPSSRRVLADLTLPSGTSISPLTCYDSAAIARSSHASGSTAA